MSATERLEGSQDPHRLVTLGYAAGFLGVGETTIRKMMKTGEVKTVNLAGSHRIRYADLLAMSGQAARPTVAVTMTYAQEATHV